MTSTHRKVGSRPMSRRRAVPLFRLDVFASGCSWLICLLLLAGDVELNPGPCSPRYPCGVCGKAVRYSDRAVACDDCNIWYHTNCMLMNTHVYESLRDSDISWMCFRCGLPNFSSRLFESSSCSDFSDDNPFEPLNFSDCTKSKSPTTNFVPTASSTPFKDKKSHVTSNKTRVGKPKVKSETKSGSNLKCFIINFQSFFNKKEELDHIVKEKGIDVIIGTETWLTPDIKNSELLLDSFDVYRRDRLGKKGGGVMVCVRKGLNSECHFISNNSESIFVKLNFNGKRPVIIGSIYRPPDNCREACAAVCKDMFSRVTRRQCFG